MQGLAQGYTAKQEEELRFHPRQSACSAHAFPIQMQIQNDFQGKDWENSILPTQDLDPWRLSEIINRLKKEQNICSSLEKWIYKWEEEGGVGGSLLLTHPGIQCYFHPPPAHRHSLHFHLSLELQTSLTEAAWARRGRHMSHITCLELALAPLIRQGWRIQMFIIISKRRKERKPKLLSSCAYVMVPPVHIISL